MVDADNYTGIRPNSVLCETEIGTFDLTANQFDVKEEDLVNGNRSN